MFVMYDDVDVAKIPHSAQAVAGYVDGSWPTKAAVIKGWPNAHKMFLTVNGSSDADGIDSEPGDASTETAVSWVKNKIAAEPGFRPVVYTSVSSMMAMKQALEGAGIPRASVRYWAAHYSGVPHLCGPQCGFGMDFTVDATQWTDKALGISLDESLVVSDFFGPIVPPAPVDPHHYLRFGMERSNVMEYDLLRRHPIKNRKALTVKRYELRNGAERVAANVIQEAKSSGKPRDWSVDYRGWRYQQLIERANGKRLVK